MAGLGLWCCWKTCCRYLVSSGCNRRLRLIGLCLGIRMNGLLVCIPALSDSCTMAIDCAVAAVAGDDDRAVVEPAMECTSP